MDTETRIVAIITAIPAIICMVGFAYTGQTAYSYYAFVFSAWWVAGWRNVV